LKKRVAIFLQGGIGAGYFSQGYPPLLNFVMKLANEYELTVYSILPANIDFVPLGFTFRSVHRGISSRKIRAILICFLFLWDHIRKPHQLLHAFWVYPAGTLVVLLGKLIGVPSLVTIQGGEAAALPQIGYGNMLRPLLKKITLWTCEQATSLNSISKFLIAEMHKHGLKRKDATVIPFGPETSLFRRATKVKGELLRIIHVANLTEVKDQETLLRAFALIVKIQPAILKIIGGDFMKGKLQRLVAQMKLTDHVEFLGAIPNVELNSHYAWADIMMHSSLHEGQSGVVMEAMACGVVVCGTRVGILYDLGDEYMETADVGDHQALASKVINSWNDLVRFHALQEKSFLWAQQFDLEWTVRKFAQLYQEIIITTGSRPSGLKK
jgi:glycosyltransferase involved in cell wall biosynthesis